MGSRRAPVLPLIEAAYDVERSPAEWLRGVIASASPGLDRGVGLCGFFVDLSNGGYQTAGYQGTGVIGSDAGRTAFEAWKANVSDQLKRYSTLSLLYGRVSAGVDDLRTRSDVPEDPTPIVEHNGFPDMHGLNALDGTLRGVSMAAPLPKGARVDLGQRSTWSRLSTHIAAGARLLRKLHGAKTSLVEGAEAVMEADGRLVDARGSAVDRLARTALREAAARIDHGRARQRHMSDDELAGCWRALYEGRWTLLDSFDHDGRRYVVAFPNEPSMPRHTKLTARETQVARAAALGHANKLIAYELGLSTSTVATLLSRVARKLGVETRVELVRRLSSALASEAPTAGR